MENVSFLAALPNRAALDIITQQWRMSQSILSLWISPKQRKKTLATLYRSMKRMGKSLVRNTNRILKDAKSKQRCVGIEIIDGKATLVLK